MYAEPSSLVGNLGVSIEKLQISKALAKLGVQSELVSSSPGSGLSEGLGYRTDFGKAHQEMLQTYVQRVNRELIQEIQKLRGGKLINPEKLLNGDLLLAEEALKLG